MTTKPYVCEFDLTPVVYPRPHRSQCDRLIGSGYAYVHPDATTGYPVTDFWCFEHAPDWVRDAAEESIATIGPGDTRPIRKKKYSNSPPSHREEAEVSVP